MPILLTLVTLLTSLLFIILYHLIRKIEQSLSLRDIFLLAVIVIGLLITGVTEGLSLFTMLTPTALKIFWTAVYLITALWTAYLFLRRKETLQALRADLQGQFNAFKTLNWKTYLLLGLIAISVLATFVIIALNPIPTNGDSMHYHLTRILVWEEQASLRDFATHTLHQISLPPFAEYAIMQINFLVGHDLYSRMVSWFALLISLVAASEIAKKFGANRTQQMITALILISIPMVIVESATTMNDLVVASWLLIFINFGLRFKHDPRSLFNAVVTGLALGMAMISKSTAFIYALPFSLWVAVSVFREQGFQKHVFKAGVVIALLAVAINAGQFTRNMITFGQPLGDDAGGTVNELFTLPALASNTIRNIQMHMLPSQGSNEVINFLGRGIRKITWNLHELTGLAPDDPRTSFRGKYVGFEKPGGISTNDGKAGGFVMLLLIFFTTLVAFLRSKDKELKQYIWVLLLTFLLFSFVLKSQIPMNRLVMPYLAIWTPVVAITLFPTNRRGFLVLSILVWGLALPWLINADSRPLLPNQTRKKAVWPSTGVEAYFLQEPKLLPVFDEVSSLVVDNQCTEVGIVYYSEKVFFEYPLWIMLKEKGFEGTIRHIMVQNESSMYEDPGYSPCVILSNTQLDSLSGYSLIALFDEEEKIDTYFVYAED